MESKITFLQFKSGLAAGLPIMIGYLPVAMAFGILSKTTGITLGESFSLSAIVFAGASQFIALNLLSIGAGIGEVILTTFIVNLRHFLMSASLSAKIGDVKNSMKPIIAFGITDEVFSVASFREGALSVPFILGAELISYASWVAGTIGGFLLGQILPEMLRSSMGIALYAMFVALLVPQVKKSKPILVMALCAGAFNSLLNALHFLPQSWCLLIAIVSVSLGGTFFIKGEEREGEENE